MICKTKHKVETQKYTININLYREITSTKMKHSNLLVSVILVFINEHYRKTNKGNKEKNKNKNKTHTHKNPRTKISKKMKSVAPALPPFLL